MAYKSTGSKYEATKGETTTQIAARIRADVKAAQTAGDLPRSLKVSVTTKYFSGGSSIDLRIRGGLEGIQVYNPERLRIDRDEPNVFHGDVHWPVYTPVFDAIKRRLKSIYSAYNFDDSDSQVDYFHVRFYGDVIIAWEYENEIRARELAALDAPTEPAPTPEPAPDPVTAPIPAPAAQVSPAQAKAARAISEALAQSEHAANRLDAALRRWHSARVKVQALSYDSADWREFIEARDAVDDAGIAWTAARDRLDIARRAIAP